MIINTHKVFHDFLGCRDHEDEEKGQSGGVAPGGGHIGDLLQQASHQSATVAFVSCYCFSTDFIHPLLNTCVALAIVSF